MNSKTSRPGGGAGRRADALLETGQRQQRQGDLDGAMRTLYAATQQFPDDWRPYLRLGAVMTQGGNWQGAASCFTIATRLQPDRADLHFNLGTALRESGQLNEAVDAFERALTLDGGHGLAFLGLGATYRRLGAEDAALVAFDCADAALPGNPQPIQERISTLIDAGRTAEALAALADLATRFPASPDAHNQRGLFLKEIGRADDAFAAFNAAVALDPRHLDGLNNRGNLLLLNRRFSEALSDFDRALAIKPDLAWLPGIRQYTAMHLFDWTDFDTRLAAFTRDIHLGRRVMQPLVLQTLSDDPATQQAASRVWMASPDARAPREAVAPLPSRDTPRLKVAYVSKDFKSHPVSYLIAEVIELHDRERFEVVAINYGSPKDDPMQQRLRAAFDAFHDVERLGDEQVVALCRGLEIDIAIDLTGFTQGARSGLFAARLAPIQLLYFGYLGTSGTTVYDYLIADDVLIPAEARPFYDERLLSLPWYQANDRQRPRPATGLTRADVGLPADAFVFCCFNNPCKIVLEQFARWAEILRGAPDSVLWVLEEDAAAATNLRAHAVAHGVASERIVFSARGSREQYLARLSLADLFLDTLPYNAGTTASDALWMGLPVLTLPGRSFAARMATSVLAALGQEELIASDAADYVAKAVAMATEPATYRRIREGVAEAAATGRLFDAPAFTRHLEAGLEQLHRRRLDGLADEDVRVT
ncbi:tetratricopeptide repeat protein [Mitsuaria sp. GD03876]|uniref:O-linked N-acetylglucosamine transferase, SPINDLY family protein n=1 Tax=Mitsuaria sp. GD03876 TaxID=2975399 RepID=UPI00244AE7DE|nr:tetratricopeptide repeat protein [Mitsuaria sp. GD03876]MDH0864051.1 tetratricopeptide repeat protein [Mitsuaria sp. GD03876]